MMTYDSKHLTAIISQAAHHLHAVVGNVATALLDINENPRMLFSNSALSQISGATLLTVAKEFVQKGCADAHPCMYIHPIGENDMVLYLTVLDDRHVFIIIGRNRDELRVREFSNRLKMLLPSTPANA